MKPAQRMPKLKIFSKDHQERAQGIVEFALVLPVLLMLILGIIEFGRLFQAWLSVQNSARFAVRYAVTGEYNFAYCNQAGVSTGFGSADTYGGDPEDCRVPNSYHDVLIHQSPYSSMSSQAQELAISEHIQVMTAAMQDYARLRSIHDIAAEDAFAISRDPSVTSKTERGYFLVTVSSTRDLNENGHFDDDLVFDAAKPGEGKYANSYKVGDAPDTRYEDPGGPGDRIVVAVDFNHPLITPILANTWPFIHLVTQREGIIENFRTSKAINVPPPINVPSPTASNTPTFTPIPTETDTPTPTLSPTPTTTYTPTITLTPSHTPTPTDTLTPSLTPTASLTPTNTPTPDCSLITVGALSVTGTSKNRLTVNVKNDNAVIIYTYEADLSWKKSQSGQYVDQEKFGSATFYTGNSYSSPTNIRNDQITLGGGANANFVVYFKGLDSRGLDGNFTLTLIFEGGRCPFTRTVSRTAPTVTSTAPPAPTATQTPVTPTHTNTPITPTVKPVNTTIPPPATNTIAAPSNTPLPTHTPVTPTNTTVPPTATRTKTPTPTTTPLGGGEG